MTRSGSTLLGALAVVALAMPLAAQVDTTQCSEAQDNARATNDSTHHVDGDTSGMRADTLRWCDALGYDTGLAAYGFPAHQYFASTRLTKPQADSLRTLIAIQSQVWADLFHAHNRSQGGSFWTSIRKQNREQLRAVLTVQQKRQFDENVLRYDDHVAMQRIRYNPWW